MPYGQTRFEIWFGRKRSWTFNIRLEDYDTEVGDDDQTLSEELEDDNVELPVRQKYAAEDAEGAVPAYVSADEGIVAQETQSEPQYSTASEGVTLTAHEANVYVLNKCYRE